MVIFWQRLEGAVALILATMVFSTISGNWLIFILLLFVPDITIAGYLINKKVGAIIYNLGHSLVLPLLLLGFGYLYEQELVSAIALVWMAHIGMDRMLGFGLKDSKGFQYTHLGKIGKK